MSPVRNSFPEEIFRFSVVRNPVTISSDKARDTVVKIVPGDAGQEYKYFSALVTLRRDAPRETIIAEARRMIDTLEFINEIEGIKRPIWRYVEALRALPKLTLSNASDLIEVIFEMKANSLASDPMFIEDRIVIIDSLVLASVVSAPVPGLRTRLMWARRAIAFIERLASPDFPDKTGSERLLMATLLLPTSVFPIPEKDKGGDDKNKKAYNRKKAALEKKNAQAQLLLDKLNKNKAAAEELSGSLSNHLFDHFHRPSDSPQVSSLLLLPAERVKTLSPETRKVVLSDLHVPETAVDVPFVISQIEQASLKLGQELTTKFGGLLAEANPLCLLTCQNIGECKGVILPPPDPDNDFTPDTRGEVEIVGIQDLLIVRQSLLEYRAGEISHIENVLQGEKKGTTYRKLDRTEVETVQEIEKEQVIENELQTTDKYELQSETSQVIQEDKHLEAGVTVTASYGSLNIETHGNYANNTSTQESKNSASTFSRDVISRSLQRVRERVLNRRTRTEITEIEVTNLHEFDNTQQGAQNISGIYRWVDKFYEAQIVNYGKRMMLEFMIPEPAAFYKYALVKKPLSTKVPQPERPGFCCEDVFYPLSPDTLQPDNYLCFVSKYNAKNVTAPPPLYLQVSDLIKYKIETTTQENPVSFAEATNTEGFKIPDGYFPKLVKYNISGSNAHSATTGGSDHDDNLVVLVTIANKKVFNYYKNEIGEFEGNDYWPDIKQVVEWGRELTQEEKDLGSYLEGNLEGEVNLPSLDPGGMDVPDTVKVSITGQSTLPLSVAAHYSVLCERSPTKFQKWQMDTFNAIMDAYHLLKEDYDDALQNQQNEVVESLQGGNPLLNREIERRELKKFSISLLTGQQYESFNAMEYDYQTGIPQIDLSDAASEGKFVRFFEQALEWINLTYLFYPYFWGRKNHWAETIMMQNTDPLFEQFLKAGYSRVWVPVRPGFEHIIINYIECGGEPWNERDPPIVGEPDEVSAPSVALIDEIKEQLGMNFEFRPGTVEVRKDKKLVVGAGTDFREDDRDREILIALKYYRIAEVDEVAQKIQLRNPYSGEDEEGIGFAIGVKFVGEPWLVQVPTTLVHLSSGDGLISE